MLCTPYCASNSYQLLNFHQKFAKKIEDAVKEGKSDEELLDIAKDGRTNTFTGAWAKATTKVNNLIDKAASSDIA